MHLIRFLNGHFYLEIYLEEDYPGENKTRIYIAYSAGNKQLKGKMFADFDLGGGLLMGGPTLTSYQPDRFRFLRYVRLQEGYYSDDFHTYRLKWTPGNTYFDYLMYFLTVTFFTYPLTFP